MIRLLLSLAIVCLMPACAIVTVRRLVVVPRCADGLPPVILVDVACPPDGICGFSCLPTRWTDPTP